MYMSHHIPPVAYSYYISLNDIKNMQVNIYTQENSLTICRQEV
jgi:hypothetical protein